MDSYTSTSYIHTDPAPDAVPPTPERPEAGRGRSVAVTVAVLAGIFAALCIIVGVGVSLLRGANENPAWRTFRAVMPGAEVVESFLTTGGMVQSEGYFSANVIPTVPEDRPLVYSVAFGMDPLGQMAAMLELYSGEECIGDASVFLTPERLDVSSETLLGGSYGVALEGLARRLEASLLAPDSGFKYALDEETFEALLELARAFDTTVTETETGDPDAITVGEVEALLSDILTRLGEVEGLQQTEERRDVVLMDGTYKLKVYTYTADEAYLLAILDFLGDEWRKNDELERVARAYLRSAFVTEEITEAELDEMEDAAYDALSTMVYDVLEALEEAIEENHMVLTLEMAVKSSYLVAFDLVLAIHPEADNGPLLEARPTPGLLDAEDATSGDDSASTASEDALTLSLRFSSAPAQNPDFTVSLFLREEGEVTDEMVFSRTDTEEATRKLSTWEWAVYEYGAGLRHTEERAALVFEWRPDLAYTATITATSARGPYREEVAPEHREETMRITADGFLYLDRTTWEVSLEYLSLYEAEAEETVIYTGEDLYVYLLIDASSEPVVSDIEAGIDPLTLSDTELIQHMEDFDGRFETFRQAVNEAVGETVFTPGYELVLSGEIPVDEYMKFCSLDSKTGNWVVISTGEDATTMTIYKPDGKNATPIVTVPLDGPVADMSADGGRIALSYELRNTRCDGTVHIFDAADGKKLAAYDIIDFPYDDNGNYDYIDCVGLDGDHLFLTTADQHTAIYMVNAATGKIIKVIAEYYQPTFVIDREYHYLFAVEQGVSYAGGGFFDTQTGEQLARIGIDGYIQSEPYTAGGYVFLEDIYFDWSGAPSNPLENVLESTQGIPGYVLRMDERIHVYMTMDESLETVMTEIYTVDGTCVDILDEVYSEVYPIGDGRYMVHIIDAYGESSAILSLEENWSILRD